MRTAGHGISLLLSVCVVTVGFSVRTHVHAQYTEEEVTEEVEALDTHTEQRIADYLRNDRCPVSFDEELVARCQYLLGIQRQSYQEMLERHLTRRGLAEDTESASTEDSATEYPTSYDPGGVGSAPLDDATEIRIQRYLKRDLCPLALEDVERQRCLYLYYERENQRSETREGRRQIRQTRRNVRVRVSSWKPPQITAQEGERIRASFQSVVPFDETGSGSQPLSVKIETMLRGYVDDLRCPVTLVAEVNERCQYLIRLQVFNRTKGLRYERASMRAALRLDTAMQRFRLPNFALRLFDARTTLEQRRLKAGFTSRPTTKGETDALGAPITIGEALDE